MNFKDSFEKYKRNEASPEEKKFVEEEIEKFQLINDNLYLELEDSLENSFTNSSEETSDKEFINLIDKNIKKAFKKLGLCVGAVLIVFVLFIQFGLSPILSILYYNPSAEIADKEGITTNQMSLDMAVYTETSRPMEKIDSINVTDKGYGNYDFFAYPTWTYDKNYGGIAGKIEKNKMTLYDPNKLHPIAVNLFGNDEESWSGGEDSKANIEGLPNGQTRYKAYVSFKDNLTFDQVKDLSADYDIMYYWNGVVTNSYESHSHENLGFLSTFSGFMIGGWDDKEYPNLQITGNDPGITSEEIEKREKDEKEMEKHFLSGLKYLNDNRKFVSMIDYDSDRFRRAYEYVKENGIKIYGISAFLTKEEMLKLYENKEVFGIVFDR